MINCKRWARPTLSRTIIVGAGLVHWHFAIGKREWAQLGIQQGQVGVYSQRAGWWGRGGGQ